MAPPIVRLYDNEQQAGDAFGKLREAGLPEDTTFLVTPGSGEEGASSAAVSSAIVAGQLLGPRAAVYAERVHSGRSMVVVDAPFGLGKLATAIMDDYGPVDTDLVLPPLESTRRSPTPLSDALDFAPLWQSAPRTVSGFLGMSELARWRKTFLAPEGATLASPYFALSSMFGMGLLSKSAAPLSSLLNLKVKSGQSGSTWTKSFGFPMLTKSDSGYRSFLGLPLLSRSGTPLSSLFGFPVLTGYR
ncbi:MAG: hypothetical protein AAFX81_04835 [Pseudomonadota bacterium]